MEAKGRTYLKVVGIILIVLGSISTIIFLFGTLGGGILFKESVNQQSESAVIASVSLIFAYAVSLIWSVLQLITGIVGVKNCDNPQKAGLCFKLGMVLIICSLISSFSQMIQLGVNVTTIIALIMGLVFPGLFCYGAKLNKQ